MSPNRCGQGMSPNRGGQRQPFDNPFRNLNGSNVQSVFCSETGLLRNNDTVDKDASIIVADDTPKMNDEMISSLKQHKALKIPKIGYANIHCSL